MSGSPPRDDELVAITVEIVSSYLTANSIAASDLPTLIHAVHGALANLGQAPGAAPRAVKKDPAVPIRKSVTPDYLVCLEDGRRLKMLKRHLRDAYGLSPEEYRARWGLPGDYPMTAPNYAVRRSDIARSFGLGKGR